MKTGLDFLKNRVVHIGYEIDYCEAHIKRLTKYLEEEREKLKGLQTTRKDLQDSINILAPQDVVYTLQDALDKIANEWGTTVVQEDKIFREGVSMRSIDGIREQYDRRTRKDEVCTLFYVSSQTPNDTTIKKILVQ